MPIAKTLSIIGSMTIRPISEIGRFSIFMTEAFKRTVFPPVSFLLLLRQLEFVGNRSLGICMIAAVMIGAVFGLILGDIFRTFGAESMIGAAAGVALSKELAPVFSGFIVTARAGSAMAAEIATMRVNEQIDAMRVMAVSPHGYLVAPRVVASVIMLPLLNCIFVLTGVTSAVFTGIAFFDIDIGTCIEKMRGMVQINYVFQGMFKAMIFGLIISSVGCYKGFFAGGGAKGVGRATTEAVVLSLVAILISDYFISYFQSDQISF
jgi:phospholipid/cholesterol/gamma-HCH transport system permease protein